MAVVNAVIMAGAARGRELAVVRMTGLTTRQVLLMTLVESVTVTVTALGLALGAVVVAPPTTLIMGVTIGALLVTAATTAATTWRITRRRPIHVAASRE
ncbi:hypothetical protein AB0C69_02495 [Actinomadura sp. NPDC048032]|uniref:hypothetical protein n=1 Tax=Actinomadura sp. NPDC048032 TaxID=3155747 RepID=UPI00340B103D